MPSTIGFPFGPSASSAKANITEKNSTGSTSPSAKAPTALVGTRLSEELAVADRPGLLLDVGHALFLERRGIDVHAGARRPQRSPAARPSTSAMVVTISK